MAKKDVIIAKGDSKWHIQKGTELVLEEFKDGEELEIGKDVPATIAADMLAHGYAVDPAAKAKAKAKADAEAKEKEEAAAKAKLDAKNPAKENKAGGPAPEDKGEGEQE